MVNVKVTLLYRKIDWVFQRDFSVYHIWRWYCKNFLMLMHIFIYLHQL